MPLTVLKPVDAEALPEYPIAKGERLESHSFFLFHFDRYLHSNLFLLGDWDVHGVALALWSLARRQDPVGTLPYDKRIIAKLLKGMTEEQFEGFMRRVPDPLHNWVPCRVEDEIRLMHPTVTEVALAALNAQSRSKDKNSADQERKRMTRLRESVVKLGAARLAADDMFIARLDAILDEQFPSGSRTLPRILKAMESLGVHDIRR